MCKNALILIGIFQLSFQYVVGQVYNTEPPKVIPPSPTAMQFQRYGDYPVSHFTGLPQISIPIFTIKEGDIELPITLDYHASGTRVNDVKGLLGQGWTLNTGGQVSRTIQGKPDENYIFKIPVETAPNINCNNASYKLSELKPLITDYETEYDIFSYNFRSNSGKFIIQQNGQPFLLSYKPLNIQSNVAYQGYGPSSYISGFDIIDENGVKFGFGGTENAQEYSEYNFNGVGITPRTTWHLTSISSAKNPTNHLQITYAPSVIFTESNQARNQLIIDDAWEDIGCLTLISDQCNNWLTGYEVFPYAPTVEGAQPTLFTNMVKYFTSVPDEILYSEGKVKIFTNPTTNMLSELHVYDVNNNLVKKFVFDVLPFSSNYSSGPFARYKLASIHIMDNANNKVADYSFNYENENITNAVPSIYCYDADYWGFYNGNTGNVNLLPAYTGFLTKTEGFPNYRNLGFANRLPSESAMKTYMLKKITYPTGGYTLFDYEINKPTASGGNFMAGAGGLRVKSIGSFSDNKKVAEKVYSYNQGTMEVLPNENDFFGNTQYGELYRDTYASNVWFRRTYYNEFPGIDYSPKGSSVVYPNVTETETSENGNNGSTTYIYDNGTACDYQTFNFPNNTEYGTTLPPKFKKYTSNLKPWNYGTLVGKQVTSNVGSYEEEYEYEEIVHGTVRDFIIEPFAFPFAGSPSECFPSTEFGDSYNFFNHYYTKDNNCFYNFSDRYYLSVEKRLKSSTSTKGDLSGSLSKTINYYYDNTTNCQPTRIITTNSKGEEIKTELMYPHDFVSSGTPNVYNEMVERHIWATPVQQSVYKNNSLLQSSRTNFNTYQNNTWGANDHNLSLALIVPQSIESKKTVGNWESKLIFDSYDGKGNIKTVYKSGDVKHTYIYGYNSKYPVADITGVDYNTVIALINSTVINNNAISEADMRAELNKIRTGLAGQNAIVTTYTYKPSIGITSQTDANNRTIFYEYDAASRLSLVRDQDNNILKKYTYSIYDPVTASQMAAQWQNSGNNYCETCKQDPSFYTGIYKVQQTDINPLSLTYNQQRWINSESPACSTLVWQPTGNYRCEQISGQNTGNREREDININPCVSPGLTRWVNIGQNISSCPLPSLFNCDNLTGVYQKSDCPEGYSGTMVNVSIPIGMFTSVISVSDANDKALQYAYAQANALGTCSPLPFDLTFDNSTSSMEGFTIELFEPGTSNLLYTFYRSSSTNSLGSILPANYDVIITPNQINNNYMFSIGCGYTQYSTFAAIYNVPLNISCKSILVSDF